MRFWSRRSERGTVMVETALLFPAMALLTFVAVEGGIIFSAYLSAGNAARDAARAIATADIDPAADHFGLQAARRSFSGIGAGGPDRIVVFRADSHDSSAPSGCLSGSSSSGLRCNVYGSSDWQRDRTDFMGGGWGGPQGWPAEERVDSRSEGADLVGVAVRTKAPTPFSVFGRDITITRTVVVQIEPRRP